MVTPKKKIKILYGIHCGIETNTKRWKSEFFVFVLYLFFPFQLSKPPLSPSITLQVTDTYQTR